MSIELNHIIIPARSKWASATFLASILDVPAGPQWGVARKWTCQVESSAAARTRKCRPHSRSSCAVAGGNTGQGGGYG